MGDLGWARHRYGLSRMRVIVQRSILRDVFIGPPLDKLTLYMDEIWCSVKVGKLDYPKRWHFSSKVKFRNSGREILQMVWTEVL